jgi:hypothetical protein
MRKFKALVNEFGLDDIGMSGITCTAKQLIKDKIYCEDDISRYSKNGYYKNYLASFIDDNDNSRNIDICIKK